MINNKELEQRSDEWHHARKGKITGTALKAIMGTPKAREEMLYEIVAERLMVGIDDDENAMDRGVRLEDEAIASFEHETDLKVDKSGLSQSDINPFIANSPDGWIGEDKAIEVKCPQGKNYVKMWLKNEIPDEYYWQVVQYFVVNEKLQKLYFVGYNPRFEDHPMHVIEVLRENIKDNKELAEKKQIAFLQEVEAILSTLIKEE